jgi:hypothetical protein
MAEESRGEPSSLKGPLADVFVDALLHGETGPLLRRLGNRAKLTDPIEGRAAGLSQLEPAMQHIKERLKAAGGVYTKVRLVRGVDHDLAEGVLALPGKTADKVMLPVATLMQRGRAREVELRLYYASKWLKAQGGRSGPVDADPDVFVPKVAADALAAFAGGRVDDLLAMMEGNAKLTDPQGAVHERTTGALTDALKHMCAGGMAFEKSGTADDGRCCAIEGNLSRLAGKDIATHPMLLVLERGDSGLFTEVRVYRDEQ